MLKKLTVSEFAFAPYCAVEEGCTDAPVHALLQRAVVWPVVATGPYTRQLWQADDRPVRQLTVAASPEGVLRSAIPDQTLCSLFPARLRQIVSRQKPHPSEVQA